LGAFKVLCVLLLAMFLAANPAGKADAATPVLYRTSPQKIVCLTIDDGYGRQNVKKALDILRAKNVKCTLFVIGSRLTAMPDLWRQAVQDGHEICYHSMAHKNMSSWKKAAILADVARWNQTAQKVLGPGYVIPKFARLPGGSGHKSQRIQGIFASLGYKLIGWSMDTYTGVARISTANLKVRITRYIKTKTKANSIILTHFNGYDVPAFSAYVGWLKGRCRLGTVSEAFAPPEATPIPTTEPTPAATPPETTPPGEPA
jgi:peptidoglycan-N-acetylmuramic acid deacetylase